MNMFIVAHWGQCGLNWTFHRTFEATRAKGRLCLTSVGRSSDKCGLLALLRPPFEGGCVTCECPGMVQAYAVMKEETGAAETAGVLQIFDGMDSRTRMCARVHAGVLSKERSMGNTDFWQTQGMRNVLGLDGGRGRF